MLVLVLVLEKRKFVRRSIDTHSRTRTTTTKRTRTTTSEDDEYENENDDEDEGRSSDLCLLYSETWHLNTDT